MFDRQGISCVLRQRLRAVSKMRPELILQTDVHHWLAASPPDGRLVHTGKVFMPDTR